MLVIDFQTPHGNLNGMAGFVAGEGPLGLAVKVVFPSLGDGPLGPPFAYFSPEDLRPVQAER